MKKNVRSTETLSGRFLLRISPGLHAALREAAAAQGLSLNDYCARKLATPAGSLAAAGGTGQVVERAAAMFGASLVGVIVFGSWARGAAADTSDIDLLVVVDRRVALRRALYRAWDEAPLTWAGRPIEPHFAHLPESDEAVTGIWAEVALDGIVLFERDFRLSARLVQVRHKILSGRLVRRIAHGQPYWSGVA
jgi:predicted nucleotidyltransferase